MTELDTSPPPTEPTDTPRGKAPSVRLDTTSRRARVGVRLGPVGLLIRHRALLFAVLLLLVLTGAGLLALFTGTLDLPASRVFGTLVGQGSSVDQLVVIDRRLSRTLAALLVGFALGTAGGLTQTITRNPIASPDLLGVTSGASLFAVFLVTTPALGRQLVGEDTSAILAPAAIAGGLVTTAAILGLSWRGGFDGLRLILVGIGVNATALSGVSYLLSRTELEQAAIATRWLNGSLSGARMDDVLLMLPVTAVAAIGCVVLSQHLGALRLGREVAAGLGTRPARTEAFALLIAVAVVSVAVAVAGPIGFVGFVAPQLAMRLFGTAGPPPLAGGLVGAAVVLLSDLGAMRLPGELPVGVITAVIGAPTLLALLIGYVRRTSV